MYVTVLQRLLAENVISW